MKSYTNVDEYIAWAPEQSRDLLKTIRQTISEEAPEAGEKISYGIPTFTMDNKYLVYFAGYENHVSIYPIPSGDKAFEKEITPYKAGKGTLRFALDKPLPLSLIRKVVKLHLTRFNKPK